MRESGAGGSWARGPEAQACGINASTALCGGYCEQRSRDTNRVVAAEHVPALQEPSAHHTQGYEDIEPSRSPRFNRDGRVELDPRGLFGGSCRRLRADQLLPVSPVPPPIQLPLAGTEDPHGARGQVWIRAAYPIGPASNMKRAALSARDC
eukprot:7388760-Prymnesium_polylepis.2